jgi:two-component system chemotaxis response regulator CheB
VSMAPAASDAPGARGTGDTAPRRVVVVGASAGGVEALRAFVAGLAADLPAAVLVVLHTRPDARSMLPSILSRSGPLPATHAQDGEAIAVGRVYVAPRDVHLLVEPGRARLYAGPRENGARPAVDALFRSAARAYGPGVVAVVLSGALDDGANGMVAVKSRGGIGIVQEPTEALYPGMPEGALAHAPVDYTLPVAEIGPMVSRLIAEPREEGKSDVSDEMVAGPRDGVAPERSAEPKREGAASGLSCPDCHGSLWELREAGAVRFECRVGHAYSVETMLSRQAEAFENALWAALNSLEERASTLRRVAGTTYPGSPGLEARLFEQAAEAEEQVRVLRDALLAALTVPRASEGSAEVA